MKKSACLKKFYRVAIPEWSPRDGMAEMIEHDLQILGHEPVKFLYNSAVPGEIDILLTFAPYNKVLPIWEAVARRDSQNRPIVIHWNTEGLPDLRIPIPVIRMIGKLRSKVGRMSNSRSALDRSLYNIYPIMWTDKKMIRFRLYGDIEYAYRKGWLDLLFDTSYVYSDIRSKNGLPTQYAPWGSSSINSENLELQRDIDVLWMGTRGTRRRSRILDQVRRQLRSNGIEMYVADNEENPFIYRETRIRFLNRAKITLNLTRTWYDDNFSRFSYAIPNRSLVVSEPLLPHCPEYIAGVHYVSAPIDRLAESIVYYLTHDDERQNIVENAYRLVTTELTFQNSIIKLMDGVTKYITNFPNL